MFKNYYTKSETYNKEEVNNLLNRYVTNDTFNNFKEEINQTIQCYVGTQGGKADDGKTSIGELTIYSPIEG